MSLPYVSAFPLLELLDRPGLRRTREQRPVYVLGGVAPRPADDDGAAVFVPLEDGAVSFEWAIGGMEFKYHGNGSRSTSGSDTLRQIEGVDMDFGAAIFFTDYSMGPAELARALEARGFGSLWAPEHSHIPLSRRSPFPQGGETRS
jgi:hypothetical protein